MVMDMSRRLRPALLETEGSGIRVFSALAAATPGCVSLTIGEPDYPTPSPVVEAAVGALRGGLTHYGPNNGSLELRAAISRFERGRGLSYEPDEIIVTIGATEAIYVTLSGILSPGDGLLVPTPAFGLYKGVAQLAGAEFRPLDTSKSGFQIEPDALEAALCPGVKAIVLASPGNPTGCLLDQKSLEAVAHAAAERELFVVCDEVYREICYEPGEFFSTRYPELRDRVIVVDSFSKPYGMTGWRVGWLAADRPVTAQLQKLHQYSVVSAATFAQPACEKALELDVSANVAGLRRRRDFVLGRLSAMSLDTVKPGGAFYLFPSIARFGLGSEEFCRRAIAECGVAAVPGVCFDGEGFIRISYCYSDGQLVEGLDRLERFINAL